MWDQFNLYDSFDRTENLLVVIVMPDLDKVLPLKKFDTIESVNILIELRIFDV